MKPEVEDQRSEVGSSSSSNRSNSPLTPDMINNLDAISPLDDSVMTSSRVNIIADENGEEVKKYKGWSKYKISVEPLNFTLTFVMTYTGAVTLNLIQRNSCNFNYNRIDPDCFKKLNATEKPLIEEESAKINMILGAVSMITPVLLSLFIGPWGEKNGRKPFIYLAFIGNLLTFLCAGVLSFYPDMNPYYLLISVVPQFFSGGMIGLYISCYCYLCDLFEPESRTFRFNVFFVSALLGSLLANCVTTVIYKSSGKYGFPAVYFSSAAISAFSLIYTAVCLQELVINKQRSWIFDMSHLKSIAELIFRRPALELFVVLLSVFVMFAAGLIMSGEMQIEYLIGKSQYSWTLSYYNIYSAATTIVSVASSSLGSLLLKQKLQLQNTTIILMSACVLVVAEIFRTGSDVSELYFWISSCFMKHYTIIYPTANAEMSKHVDYEDLGKLYSFTALIDSVSTFASGPLYTAIYDSLVFSGTTLYTFYISALLGTLIALSAFVLRLVIWKKERVYNVTTIGT